MELYKVELSDWIALASFIIAVISLLYSWLTGRKLKKQQILINNNLIAKDKEEQQERQKAIIECYIVPSPDTNKLPLISICNKGKSIAYNVNVQILDNKEEYITFHINDDFFPYPQLAPGQKIDIRYISLGPKKHYTVKFIWDDNFCKKRSQERIVDF